MQIYVLRHGIAEDKGAKQKDAERKLTEDGRTKLDAVVKRAEKAGVKPSVILTSPLVRAVQTAEVAAKGLGYQGQLIQTATLEPNGSPAAVWQEIRNHRDAEQVLLAGHEPQLSQLVSYLLGSPSLQIEMKKGGLVAIDMARLSGEPKGVLLWYLTPKLA